MVEIKGLEKLAPKDYPGFISSTVFLGGCNFRCPYCNNADLVLRPETIPDYPHAEFIKFLDARKDWLEAVCLSGGEPLLHENLEDLISLIKKRGFLVKIDTNGSFPERLEELKKKNLVDYIAMDIKAPIERYQEVAGTEVVVENIEKSIEIIKDSKLEYMFRTTVVPGLIGPKDIEKIGQLLKGAKLFQIQQFSPISTLDKTYLQKNPYEPQVIQELSQIAQPYFQKVKVEGV